MGNIFYCCILDDVSKLDDEIRKLLDKKKNQKFGICNFCDRARACSFKPLGLLYNGTEVIMICIECEKELNKKVLY